jgi:glycosyltransferase involved in cell wall biosynthesis
VQPHRSSIVTQPPNLYRLQHFRPSMNTGLSPVSLHSRRFERVGLRRPVDAPVGEIQTTPAKQAGSATFVFASRVSANKNLHFFLQLLRDVIEPSAQVRLEIYGSIDDDQRSTLDSSIASLPASVAVRLHGPVPPSEVRGAIDSGHFTVLPTLGENFGHAVWESLAAGRPILMSDTTPWTKLEESKAGWALPLDDIGAWQNAIRNCVDMTSETWLAMCASSRRYATDWHSTQDFRASHRRMLDSAMAHPQRRV